MTVNVSYSGTARPILRPLQLNPTPALLQPQRVSNFQRSIFQRRVILMTEPGPDSSSQAGGDNSGGASTLLPDLIVIEPTEYTIPGCRVAIRGIGCCDDRFTYPPYIPPKVEYE